MKIAIVGGNGYIGRSLAVKLLNETNHSVITLSPNVETMSLEHERLTKINCDVFDQNGMAKLLAGCNVAYYLIHMMAVKHVDFAQAEAQAAKSFSAAANKAGVVRVVYLGGLGNDHEQLSKHLDSRHTTGRILQERLPQVIEFRASMVIGHGSISYDIIVNLVKKLPIMTLPKWARTMTQPIGLGDALDYLVAAIDLKDTEHHIVEIGGPDVVSYGDLMKRYAQWINKKMVIVKLHAIPVSVAAWWLNLFTPGKHAKVGRIMVDSLSNPMVVTNNDAEHLFPKINPKPLEEVFC